MQDTLFEVEAPEPENPALPPLRGTEKQIVWANVVREEKIAAVGRVLREWQSYIERLRDGGREDAADRERQGLRDALDASETLMAEDHAAYWLDRRFNTAKELLAGDMPKPGPGKFRRDE